jgi:hypothetical protein
MTLTKTEAVPPDRRLRLDLTLPDAFVPGSLFRLEIRSGKAEGEAGEEGAAGAPPKTKESMLAAVDCLCGLYAGVEPPGAYLERHRAEALLERELEDRREKERGLPGR